MLRYVSLIALAGCLCFGAPNYPECPEFISAYQSLELGFERSPSFRFWNWWQLVNEIRAGNLARKFCGISSNRKLVDQTLSGAAKALENAGAVVKHVSIVTPRWGVLESVCLDEGSKGPLADFMGSTAHLQNAGFSPLISLATKRGAHYVPLSMLFLDWFSLNWGRPSPIAYHERTHHFTLSSPLRGADHPLVGELKALARHPISHEAARVGAYTHQQLLDEPLAFLEATFRVLVEFANHFKAGGNPNDLPSQTLYRMLKQSLAAGILTAFQNMQIAEAVLADQKTELSLLGLDTSQNPERPLALLQLTVKPEQVVFPIFTADPTIVDDILLEAVASSNLGQSEMTSLYGHALQEFISRRVMLVRAISRECSLVLRSLEEKVTAESLTPKLISALKQELSVVHLNLQRRALLPSDERRE